MRLLGSKAPSINVKKYVLHIRPGAHSVISELIPEVRYSFN